MEIEVKHGERNSDHLFSMKLGVGGWGLVKVSQALARLLNEGASPQFSLNQRGLEKEVTFTGLQLCARHCRQFV